METRKICVRITEKSERKSVKLVSSELLSSRIVDSQLRDDAKIDPETSKDRRMNMNEYSKYFSFEKRRDETWSSM